MLRNINHKFLGDLGLAVWQPRPFRHPEKFPIVPQHIRVNARCLVLLQSKLEHPAVASAAQETILNGMLSVLELPASDIMRATIYGANPNIDAVCASIRNWKPQSILQLSMELPSFNIGIPYVQTYSPEYLLDHKQHKAEAYKSLLNLRAMLNGTS